MERRRASRAQRAPRRRNRPRFSRERRHGRCRERSPERGKRRNARPHDPWGSPFLGLPIAVQMCREPDSGHMANRSSNLRPWIRSRRCVLCEFRGDIPSPHALGSTQGNRRSHISLRNPYCGSGPESGCTIPLRTFLPAMFAPLAPASSRLHVARPTLTETRYATISALRYRPRKSWMPLRPLLNSFVAEIFIAN
jgi:hypothetical protein